MKLRSPTIYAFHIITFQLSAWSARAYHLNSLDRVFLNNESIANYIDEGDTRHFTITAHVQGHADTPNSSPFWETGLEANTISIDVIKAFPAITPDTFILSADGTQRRFGDSGNSLDTILVSDVTTSAGRSGLAILAVNPLTHEMNGILEKKGSKLMKIHQGNRGGVVMATDEDEVAMPAWECGVRQAPNLFHRLLEEDHGHHDEHVQKVSLAI